MNDGWRILIIVIPGLFGSIGFALIFGVNKKHMIFALIPSLISCLTFELVMLTGAGMLISALAGAALAASYSDIMAHKIKTPATIMIIIGIIPLVPGAKLYYTMEGIVQSDKAKISKFGGEALMIAAGIAVGIIAVTAISRPINTKISETLNKTINKAKISKNNKH